MDINQLICFISAAQTLNFSEAARRNYVSQSTVSRYIGDLEKEFGVRLFTRSHRDVILTNEGKTLLPYAVEAVDTINKAKTVVKQLHDGGKGKITVGCDITSLSFPSKCIEDFGRNYPSVNIDIRQLDITDCTQALSGGEYDFCFMPRDMVPENSSVETLATHTDPLVAVTGVKNKFRGRSTVGFSELAGEKLLLLSEAVAPILYMEIMDLLRTFHISPKVESRYNDLMSMYVAVTAERGITIIPESLANYLSPDHTKILEIDNADTSIAYVMAWSKAITNPVAGLFIETAKKYSPGDDDVYGL